jgi:hypothetical protein
MKIVFSDEKYSDFKQLVQQVDIPENSVIVARHGVQYLSAWHFETDVVLESYFETADLSSYSAVFILVENRTSEKKEDAPTLQVIQMMTRPNLLCLQGIKHLIMEAKR